MCGSTFLQYVDIFLLSMGTLTHCGIGVDISDVHSGIAITYLAGRRIDAVVCYTMAFVQIGSRPGKQ